MASFESAQMKTKFRACTTAAAVAVALVVNASPAARAQTCQPGIIGAYTGAHSAQFQALADTLVPAAGALTSQLAAMVDAPTYDELLTTANALAASTPSGRLVITLADGTVVLDTARDDHATDPTSNSYQHFVDKTINENHNSRVAILAAQEYPCGFGLEGTLRPSAGRHEAYLALRAGPHLASYGTLTLSTQVSVGNPPREVSIIDFAYAPSTLTVAVGTTVAWQNNGRIEHTTTASPSVVWDSGLMVPGERFMFTFGTPGTYTYRCDLHPFMVGSVVVE